MGVPQYTPHRETLYYVLATKHVNEFFDAHPELLKKQ